jgi:hypothetical protein
MFEWMAGSVVAPLGIVGNRLVGGIIMKYVLLVGFIGCVVGANWALQTYGFVDLVGPGMIMVPAGVYFAGLAFGIRDALHEADSRLVLPAIAVGALVSWWIEPAFAVASGVAFGLAELADYAIYSPLRKRQWTTAVIASGVVGAVADSLLFLNIAFNSTAGWFDLTVGKVLMIVPAIPVVYVVRRLRHRPMVEIEELAQFTVMVPGDS